MNECGLIDGLTEVDKENCLLGSSLYCTATFDAAHDGSECSVTRNKILQ